MSTAANGILLVDKAEGWTSHDVVAKARRALGTRKVGHAGTLDPMATGVLLVGVNRATRLLGHLAGHDKTYEATIALGASTVSDDAEGELVEWRGAAGVGEAEVRAVLGEFTGVISQVPSAVSAIKVDGRRAYDRVRAGQAVELDPRPVLVSVFDIVERRVDAEHGTTDLDVEVTCSSGTYVRALARDLGAALGVGGHLTALRRLRVGGFEIAEARTLEELAGALSVMDLSESARAAFPVVSVDAAAAAAVRFGRPLDLSAAWSVFRSLPAAAGTDWAQHVEPHALLDPDGQLLALVAPTSEGGTRYLAVFAQP